jgi:NADH-quinone oxidoreductase subunit F
MNEQVLFLNKKPDRPINLDEYCQGGGYRALDLALRKGVPEEITKKITDSGLRGRGGAGYPTGRKWSSVRKNAPFPRYILANTDEMEPGTFKDRVLASSNPHLIIEGIVLAGYAISASKGFFFVRPSYESVAEIMERAIHEAREAGYLGDNIMGSNFSFHITLHRSAGRYICGEASAQINAIQGNRVHPIKGGAHMTDKGLWDKPTVVNNVETLACVPGILRNGSEWFRGLARTEKGAGTKLYSISGMVRQPGCYELPIGTPLSEIIEGPAGGMSRNSGFKACLPGGASTPYLTSKFYDIEMDFDSLKAAGNRLGTAAIVVFGRETCLVGATLNLMEFFARESCGFCTPCREGLPFVRELLRQIENGEGKESFIAMLREMAGNMNHSYCAFAPGAVASLTGLLDHFIDEIHEHISQKKCPFPSCSADRGTEV